MQKEIGTATKKINENLADSSVTGDNLKEKVVNKVGETKERFSQNLSSAADKFHEKSDSAQEFLDARTDNITDYAHQAIGKVNEFGHRAADALNNSSEYINNFDYEKTKQQMVETIKEKPQIGLAVAGLFGLILGIFIGRKKSN